MRFSFTLVSFVGTQFLLASVLAFVAISSAWATTTYIYTSLDVPGASYTSAQGINNTGQIVGSFGNAKGTHGFVRDSSGAFTTLDVPNLSYAFTEAFGINNTGQIVGYFHDVIGSHGFVQDSSSAFTTLDVPGASHTSAFGINNAGQIVGNFEDTTGAYHGFVRDSSGVFTTLDDPGSFDMYATGINDAGLIVGTFVASGIHGFLASPTPEPKSLLLFGFGLATLAVIRRRKGAEVRGKRRLHE